MVIRPDDRVATLIREDESLIDVFASLSPAFERLRSPAMRKVMARLVTVEQAARMAGIDADHLVQALNAHMHGEPATQTAVEAGDAAVEQDAGADGSRDRAQDAQQRGVEPPALAAIASGLRTELDVREELRAGNEPFRAIMGALRERPAGGAFAVRAIFEPVPLYAVMRRQGLAHHTEELGAEDWRVWFYPDPTMPDLATTSPEPAAPDTAAMAAEDDVVVLDVRGLEPPEPMMRTLVALETLPADGTLVQLNERVPQFLLPLLEERGFAYEVREQDEDVVRVFIRRRTA